MLNSDILRNILNHFFILKDLETLLGKDLVCYKIVQVLDVFYKSIKPKKVIKHS